MNEYQIGFYGGAWAGIWMGVWMAGCEPFLLAIGKASVVVLCAVLLHFATRRIRRHVLNRRSP